MHGIEKLCMGDVSDGVTMAVTDHHAYKLGAKKGEQFVHSFRQSGSMTERIAGGVMAIAVVAVVLNQLFTLDIVNNTSGPFAGLIDSVTNVGGAALTLVVLGFLAAAAGAVLTMFRGGF